MAAYQAPQGMQAVYDPSGQQFSSWAPQATGWGAQQQEYQYPANQQAYNAYAAAQATNTQYPGQDAPGMYSGGYDYNNMGYVGQGYAGQAGQAGDASGGQYMAGGAGDGQQFGYMKSHQWGWDQSGPANGGPPPGDAGKASARGRGGMGGGRGGPPAFGSGRGGGEPTAFGSRRGGGGAPAFGSGRGGGGPPAFGSGRGEGGPPSFGSGRGGGASPAFGSGRGGAKPAFGSGGDRGRGGFGSDEGTGYEERGGGFGGDRITGRGGFGGDRGRGSSGGDRGRGGFGGGDRGRGSFGGGDRGRGGFGGGDRGRGGFGGGDRGKGGFGGGDRGRGGFGGGDRGRGRGSVGRGGVQGRGRGAGGGSGFAGGRRGGADFGGRVRGGGAGGLSSIRGRGAPTREALVSTESVTVADTGVGLSSIGDLIKSAHQRRLQDASKGLSSDAPLSAFVARWKTFSQDFVDCGNPISNLECSLKASKLILLLLRSETDLLSKVSISAQYNIFTSTLVLVKKVAPLDHRDQESIFLARGLGLNKKAAKADCYEKAHKLLMESSVNEIMSQVDPGEATLRQEIQILHRENPKGFLNLLRKTTENTEEMGGGLRQQQQQQAAAKRKAVSIADHTSAKKPRPLLPDDYIESQSSLAPKKKQGMLMQKSAPLPAKLSKLKELLKEEGITKLHIVPKIDQFAQKTALTIRNVYKFIDIPTIGFEHKTPLYCEIYFDDVWVASSEPHIKRTTAMTQAYCNFTDTLCSEPVEKIANNPRRWSVAMEAMPDVCSVNTKWQGLDNDSLLTSNLANMKQMMHSMPNLKFPIHKMVLTEHETDKNTENIFKALELSATRNLVLLECEMLRNPDDTFTCNISLQGKVMATRVHSVKNAAKRLASEAVMKQLKQTNDFVYVTADYVGKTYTKEDLFRKAREKRDAGENPPNCLLNIASKVLVKKPPEGLGPEALKRFEEDAASNAATEDLPENKELRPLLPFLAMVTYDIIDNYYETLSVEDIIFDVKGMARSQREVIGMCANRMGMRINTKVRNMEQSSLLRRCIIACDMKKILQIHGGTSGRYKLTVCNNPCSQEELDAFKQEYLATYQAFKDNRDFEEDEAVVPKMVAAPPPQIKTGAMKTKGGQQPPNSAAAAKAKGPPGSAWENNEPLDFKGPGGAGRGGGARGRGRGAGPRPLMDGRVCPPGQRAPEPGPPRQGVPARQGLPPRLSSGPRPPQPLMQPRPQRMGPPWPRMGGPFQY